jgi:hypothetical protein
MEWLAKILDFLFGCRHRNLSWIFSMGGQTYRVCWDCGAKFSYSLTKMSIVHRIPAFRVAALRHVNASETLNSGDISCCGLSSTMPRTL